MSVHIVLTNLNVAKLNSSRCSSCDRVVSMKYNVHDVLSLCLTVWR